jgi:hypothetical protein
MEFLFLAVLLGLIPAMVAKSKGKSFGLWWLYGALLFIIALPHALIMRPDIAAVERRRIAQEGQRKCPYCAELIKAEARVCRYCGREVAGGSLPSSSDRAPQAPPMTRDDMRGLFGPR